MSDFFDGFVSYYKPYKNFFIMDTILRNCA